MRTTIIAILLALGAVEGAAYWWMHPAPAGLGQPVLCYSRKHRAENTEPSPTQSSWNIKLPTSNAEHRSEEKTQAPSSTSDHRALITGHSSSASLGELGGLAVQSSYTFLPEVVAHSLPLLHCSTGTAARIDRDGGVTIHLAFFEWNLADSGNVLEAYKHLPDVCMGSIGMTLIEKAPLRTYVVRGQDSSTFSTDHRSLITDHSIYFDHTIFRDPGGVIVHAFKGVWVSGADKLLGEGQRGGLDEQRMLRWKAALKRFHPAYGRVAQGAVRGIQNPDLAWKAFEETMLVDLKLENQ